MARGLSSCCPLSSRLCHGLCLWSDAARVPCTNGMSWRIAIPVMSGPEILASGRASVVTTPSACMRTARHGPLSCLACRCQWCLLDALQSEKRAMSMCACLVCGYWSRQEAVQPSSLTLITRTKGSRRSCDLLRHDSIIETFRSRPDRATD